LNLHSDSHHHVRRLPSPLINNRPRRKGIRLPARYRSPEIPYREQIKLCVRHPHEKPRREFIDSESNKEFDTCNQCRQEIELYQRRLQELEDELERTLAEDLEIDENGRQGQYLTRTNFLISI
jgi:DNA mismatch repair ATPase MutS